MCFCTVGGEVINSAFLLLLPRAPQMSQDIPVDADLCDKAAVLFAATNISPVSYFD
jgi:hypothetical protein